MIYFCVKDRIVDMDLILDFGDPAATLSDEYSCTRDAPGVQASANYLSTLRAN